MGNGASSPAGVWLKGVDMELLGPLETEARLAGGSFASGGGTGGNRRQPPSPSPRRGSDAASIFDGINIPPAMIRSPGYGKGPSHPAKPGPKIPAATQSRKSLSNFLSAASGFAVRQRMQANDAGPAMGGATRGETLPNSNRPFGGGATSPPPPNVAAGFRNSSHHHSNHPPPRGAFGGRLEKKRTSVGDGSEGDDDFDYGRDSPPPLEHRSPRGTAAGQLRSQTGVTGTGTGTAGNNNFLPTQAATAAAAEAKASKRAAAQARAEKERAATAAVTLKEKTYDGFKVPRVKHCSTVREATTFLSCDRADLEYAEVTGDVLEGVDGRFWLVKRLALERKGAEAEADSKGQQQQQQQQRASWDYNDQFVATGATHKSPSPSPPPPLQVSKGQGLWRLRPVGDIEPGVAMAANRCRDGRVELPHNAAVDFITDVEGQWEYFATLVKHSDILFWDDWGELDLKENGYLVHGGDATDKGCGDIQVVKALVGLKQRYPDRVFLILGNRDVNKMRFRSELAAGRDGALIDVFWDAGHVPFAKWLEVGKRPTSKRLQTLQWMLECTMGCQTTFETRRRELALLEDLHIEANTSGNGGSSVVDPASVPDEAVYDSFVNSVDPDPNAVDPWMLRYLELGQVAAVLGDTLFVHGAVNKAALDYVPGWSAPAPGGLLGWVSTLNAWAVTEVEQFKATKGLYNPSGIRAAEQMLAYFLPLPPSHLMAGKSCIYNNGFVKNGKYVDPQPTVAAACNASGVTRILVGHLPRGQCPAVILNGHRTLMVVMSDTSYSDMDAPKERNPANNRGLAHALVTLTASTTQVKGVVSDGSAHSALMQYPANRKSVSKSSSTPSSLSDLDGLAMELGLELTQDSADKFVGLELADGSRIKTVLRSGEDAGKVIVAADERKLGEVRCLTTGLDFRPRPSKGSTPAHAGAQTPEGDLQTSSRDPRFNARADELSAMLATAFDGIWGPGGGGGSGGGSVAGTSGGTTGNATPTTNGNIVVDASAGAGPASAFDVGTTRSNRKSNALASKQWSQIRGKHSDVVWREMLQSSSLDLHYDFNHASEDAAADLQAHIEAVAAAASPPDGTLAAARKHALENLKAKLHPLPIAHNDKFTATLQRFLSTCGYHPDRAAAAVRAHVTWQEATFPIKSSEFAADPFFRRCGIFQFGRDLEGRSLVVLKGSAFCPKERGAALCERGVTYVIESIVGQFDSIDVGNSSTFSIIFDLEGFSTSKHLDRELIKRIFAVIRNHYPQRLHQIYFAPCSWKFKIAGWPLLRSCMDSQSRSKVMLLKSKSDVQKYVVPGQLEESFGGTSTFVPQPFDLSTAFSPVGVAAPW